MNRKLLAGAVALVLAPAGIGAVAYSSSSPAQPAAHQTEAAPSVPVVAAPVTQGDVPIYLRGIGTVQAYITVTVRTQVQGQITEIAFKEGQAVHKGDVLVQIDPRAYQAALDQAIGNRDRDQAQLAN